MTIRHVRYTSRQAAEALPGDPATAVISITDPGMPAAQLAPDFGDVLRLSFFDAQPADEYLPAPIPGLFDHRMARTVSDFVHRLHADPAERSLLVHCEYGISRSAAIALFAESLSGAPLEARDFTSDANPWVVDRLQQIHPDLALEIPPAGRANDRRRTRRD